MNKLERFEAIRTWAASLTPQEVRAPGQDEAGVTIELVHVDRRALMAIARVFSWDPGDIEFDGDPGDGLPCGYWITDSVSCECRERRYYDGSEYVGTGFRMNAFTGEAYALPPELSIKADDDPVCRMCGCWEEGACKGGCHWVEPDLCSTCMNRIRRAAPALLEALKLVTSALYYDSIGYREAMEAIEEASVAR